MSLGRRVAVIDVGSNSIRLVVADVAPDGRIAVVEERRETPRLGAGLHDTGRLSDGATGRALEALHGMATLAGQRHAERVVAVATSAVRDAVNGADFLQLVRETTGLALRVLDGTEEANLALRSARAHFDLDAGRTVVMDVGGGSLELALSAPGTRPQLHSHPLGAIRLTERFLARGQSRRAVRRLRDAVRAALRESVDADAWRAPVLIGSGGTFTALAAIHLRHDDERQARAAHGAAIPREAVEALLEELRALSPAARRRVRGLNPQRADIIVAGLAAAAEVAAHLDAPELLVSAYGIREGLLLESADVPDPGELSSPSATPQR
ncbi:MAG TPA: hypothetical protein VFS08_19210 [Gemmatimonadaceae bacterium]|nr:hypothetical protein [Gemmatimonadaceae bacterium]